MKKKLILRIFSFAAVMSLAAVGLAGCGSETESSESSTESLGSDSTSSSSTADSDSKSSDDKEKITIRLADQSPSFSLIYSFAQDNNYFDDVFADDNVEIVINDFASGPVLNESFAAGEVDFGTLGAFPFLSGYDNEYDYKIIGKINYTDYFPLIAAKDSGIETAADLKGKTLGTAIGGQYHYLLLKHLEKAGLTADDVEIINSSSDTPTLIRSQDIDATALSATVVGQLVDEGAAYILEESPDDIIAGYIIAADKFTNAYPELTQKLLNAVGKAIENIAENPDIYSSYLSEKTAVDKSYIDEFISHQTFEIEVTDVDIESLSEEFEYMKSESLITNEDTTANDWINREYLKNLN